MFRHIVLFRVRDEVADADVDDAILALRSLGASVGIHSFDVDLSLDTRKGRIIVEDATFADSSAFTSWREGEAHGRVAARMAQISDWWVGDMERS